MTLLQLYSEGGQALAQAGVADAQIDARAMLLAAFDLDMTHFLLERLRELPEDAGSREAAASYRAMVQRRAAREPLQQILGSAEFMGLPFFVNEHVLVPRQDTETLVELVLERCGRDAGKKRVLDLCTGSGCIAVSLAVRGRFGQVDAADISAEALAVARRNAETLCAGYIVCGPQAGGMAAGSADGQACLDTAAGFVEESAVQTGRGAEARSGGGQIRTDRGVACGIDRNGMPIFRLLQGDLFRALPCGHGTYDVIVSNPPYIPADVIAGLAPEVRDHEPRLALDGGADGLSFYRRIAAEAGAYLASGGQLFLEIGYDQGTAVKKLLEKQGFAQVEIRQDLAGHDRVVSAVS